MICCSRPLGVLRSLVCLALIGVAVVVLIGPALAVVGVLLPFAVIGALAWGGYRFGRTMLCRVRGRRQRLVFVDVSPAPRPAPAVTRPVMDALPAPQSPSRLGRLARSATQILVEVGCGAALGAALAVVVDWQTVARVEHAALGAAIGAVVGFVVGGSRSQPALETPEANGKAATRAA
jgi:hypothetical protein